MNWHIAIFSAIFKFCTSTKQLCHQVTIGSGKRKNHHILDKITLNIAAKAEAASHFSAKFLFSSQNLGVCKQERHRIACMLKKGSIRVWQKSS